MPLNSYPGRTPKLSKEVIDKACELIKEGNYDGTVAALLGISTGSWYRWKREGQLVVEGREDEIVHEYSPKMLKLLGQFYTRVIAADAEAETFMVERVKTATYDDWKAASWYLERRKHETWGRKDKVAIDHSGKVDGENTVTHKLASDPKAAGLLRELFRLQQQGNTDQSTTEGDEDDPMEI